MVRYFYVKQAEVSCKKFMEWIILLQKRFLISYRVAWKVRCKDDPDIERYTKDCNIEMKKTFPSRLFKPGVMEPAKRKEGVRKADIS